jgi:UDPglucose 6-dehydrogenase
MAGVSFPDSAHEALAGADACVIVTDWPEFAELDWQRAAGLMQGKIVIDGRNLLDPHKVRNAGLVYEGIGR